MGVESGKIQREGDRVSDMLKVCSYRRSGTHYLMALCAANFKFKEDLSIEAMTEQDNKWLGDGKTKAVVPWGKLFLTHGNYGTALEENMIYIYRHPVDVFRSLWEFLGKKQTLVEFVTEAKIEEWKAHVDGYINAGVYSVRYDRLCAMPVATLNDIKNHFELKLKDGEFHPITERVGWKEKAKIAETEGYSENTLDMFRNVLGNEYRGFKL